METKNPVEICVDALSTCSFASEGMAELCELIIEKVDISFSRHDQENTNAVMNCLTALKCALKNIVYVCDSALKVVEPLE